MTESGSDAGADSEVACDCKVGTVSEQYGVAETLLDLEARWTAPRDERASVRTLADVFNRTVLRAALTDAGVTSLASDVGTTYRQLTDDDVSSGTRTEVQRRLAREGVPVEAVVDDFVSHQSMYLHLTECRDLSFESDTAEEDRLELTRDRLMALRERFVLVSEDKIAQLERNGAITTGSPTVLVDVDVFCDECGSSYQLDAYLDRGGCDCGPVTDE